MIAGVSWVTGPIRGRLAADESWPGSYEFKRISLPRGSTERFWRPPLSPPVSYIVDLGRQPNEFETSPEHSACTS